MVAILVSLILYVLEPFSIDRLEYSLFFISILYGLVSGVTTLLFALFLRYALKIERDKPSWTYLKWLSITMMLIMLISVSNYILTVSLVPNATYNFANFLVMLKNTLIIAIFPVTLFGALSLNKNKTEFEIIANEIEIEEDDAVDEETKIEVINANQETVLIVLEQEILFLEAMQNYVMIHHLIEEKVNQQIIRNTISNLEDQFKEKSIVKCHRSFLVNTHQIDKVEGNAQGLKLTIKHSDFKVPVSRKYIPYFKALKK